MTRPRTLRARLALLFGLGITVVATAFGGLLLHQARLQLANAIDEGLVPLATDLSARVGAQGPTAISGPLAELHPPSDAAAQVLDAQGRVLTTSGFPGDDRPLLQVDGTAKVAGSGRRGRHRATVARFGGGTSPVRALAVRVQTAGRPVVLVVATSFDESRRLEEEFERALTVGLPILAAGLALGGWLVTGAMFKPVRSMIQQADRISAREPRERLQITSGGAELLALAARLNAMLDRIDAAAAHERAFLDDASHELRTPISIVRGELELARTATAGDDDLRGLDSVLDEVERLERLAYNLLVLARSRSGTLAGADTPVDLETVIQRATRAIARRAGNSRIHVGCHGNAVVNGDEGSLQRAVINLLDNAVRYAASEVTVRVEEHASVVDVCVADDGPGFDPAVLPHAFDRFTRDPGSGGGMGLGLAITAAIATSLGGQVSAANLPNGGAEVRLSLPAA